MLIYICINIGRMDLGTWRDRIKRGWSESNATLDFRSQSAPDNDLITENFSTTNHNTPQSNRSAHVVFTYSYFWLNRCLVLGDLSILNCIETFSEVYLNHIIYIKFLFKYLWWYITSVFIYSFQFFWWIMMNTLVIDYLKF